MIAYIDEAGHTGSTSFDSSQPYFYNLGIVSSKDLDVYSSGLITTLCKELKVAELHANEIRENYEEISKHFIKHFSAFDPYFAFCVVEKDYLAFAKLFDTIFDEYENYGARHHIYNMKFLRFLMMAKLAYITPIEVARVFYQECLFAKDSKKSIEILKIVCRTILTNTIHLPDIRSREIISDALSWAIDHPHEMTTYNERRDGRWRHLPNMVTFMPMLDMLARISQNEKSRIEKIVHDEQYQMKSNFILFHKIAADKAKPDMMNLFDNGTFLLSTLKESIFEMKNSKDSPGIQQVDICLYALTHQDFYLNNRATYPNTVALLNLIGKRLISYDLTFDHLYNSCSLIVEKLYENDFSEAELQQAKKMIDDAEQRFHERRGGFISKPRRKKNS